MMQELLDTKILTIVTFTPAVGALVLLFLRKNQQQTARVLALGVTLLTFVFSLHLFWLFDSTTADFQFVSDTPWIPSFGISYQLGVDGISLFLVLLPTFLTPLAILASWSITDRVKEYFIVMLLLETGMVGVFVSLDLFLFYVFGRSC